MVRWGLIGALAIGFGLGGGFLAPGLWSEEAEGRPPKVAGRGAMTAGTIEEFGREIGGPYTVRALFEVTEGRSEEETVRGVKHVAIYEVAPGVAYLSLRLEDGTRRYFNLLKLAYLDVAPAAKERDELRE